MTGYAAVRHQTSSGELSVSLRSVNHRGLDLHFYLGGELAPFENSIRTLLKSQLTRGHVEVRIGLAADAENARSGSYNRELLGRYLNAFRQASVDFRLNAEPDLSTLFSLPGVVENGREPRQFSAGFESELLAAGAACARDLNEYRSREGNDLRVAIEGELSQLEAGTAEIQAVRTELSTALYHRLRERVQILLAGSGVPEGRIAEEVAVLADRSDVQEELTRLSVHAALLRRMLQGGGQVGKRLDCLLQEINRETNTVLSKSSTIADSGLTITGIGIAVKANIERMREQALNLE